MMRISLIDHFRTRSVAAIVALACCAAPSVAADMAKDDIGSNLQLIQKSADEIAAGQYKTKDQLQAPARSIALAWSKAEPMLAKSGSALVETKFANQSIATFERDWQSPVKARSDAKDVSQTVGDLINAQKT
jgi:hypothetical protein